MSFLDYIPLPSAKEILSAIVQKRLVIISSAILCNEAYKSIAWYRMHILYELK